MLEQMSLLDELLLYKALTPLTESDILELERIQKLDIKDFTEADIRAEIIDVVVKILGYRKGEFSSVDREKHISFVGKTSRYIDYNLTL